jgi:ethanolamine utilization protein EutM
MQEALGIIETLGFATAVQAADASVKAANVKLGDLVKVGGGRMNVVIRGDVAAVKASVEAGVAAASQIGKVTGQAVIPRPSDKLSGIFPIDVKKPGKG